MGRWVNPIASDEKEQSYLSRFCGYGLYIYPVISIQAFQNYCPLYFGSEIRKYLEQILIDCVQSETSGEQC